MTMTIKKMIRQLPRVLMLSISIAIGICAVLLINAMSSYGISSAEATLDRLGLNGYIVSSINISDNDIILLNSCSCIEDISPVSQININGPDEGKDYIFGCNPSVKDMFSLNMIAGDFFSYTDVFNNHDVCIISSNKAKNDYGSVDCIGQCSSMIINGNSQRFTVIGVYESDKLIDSSGLYDEEPIYAPYSVINSLCAGTVQSLMITVSDISDINKTNSMLSLHCDKAFGKGNYTVTNTAEGRSKINSLMYTVKQILEIIVSISLIVAVSGLVLIMIINIYNRRKEIGLKKAIGAKNVSILKETVLEAVILTVTGIIEGTILFIIFKMIFLIFQVQLSYDFKFCINVFIITVFSSSVVSLIPAWIAAKTEPAQALKNE